MKGVILAGGLGSRLDPLTKVTNKHLLPVGRFPMIVHVIKKIVESEINDIMIITGTEHMGDMITLLGSGKNYNCHITYRVQDKPDGIAGALLLCENFIRNEDIVVVLGDNIFKSNLKPIIKKFKNLKKEVEDKPICLLNLYKVKNPSRFGVPTIVKNKIIKITEKPKNPDTDYCVTGIYMYDKNVFDYIRQLSKSDRNEYEITDVNNLYVKNGFAGYNILCDWWTDAGTHSSYQLANRYCYENG